MSKLLLIIALAVFSFARSRPVTKATDDVSLYYNNEVIDSEGKITKGPVIEESGYPAKIAIDTLKPRSTTAATAETFRAIDNTTFDTLKIGATLTVDEKNCDVVSNTFNGYRYVLYGASAFLYASKKIAPSITGLVANGPATVGTALTKDCSYSQSYLNYGLYAEGVVGTDCIPNTKVPDDGKVCVDDEPATSNAAATYAPALKGYREGHFFGLKAAAVKDLIVRFGAVVATFDDDLKILIGWKKVGTAENWIEIALERDENTNFIYEEDAIPAATTNYDGTVIFDDKLLVGCVDVTKDTTIEVCPCPTDKDSDVYKADPRTEKKGICAAGTMRAAWAVVVAVLAVPALSLFW